MLKGDPVSRDNGGLQLQPEEYDAFRECLARSSGLVLGEHKQYLVVSRLTRLLRETGLGSLRELLAGIRSDSRLRARAIEAMMTHETFWFRDAVPFNILSERVLPDLAQRQRRRLRIWSAACSYGQEPYSIGMMLEELARSRPGLLATGTEILATDLSLMALQKATAGVYDHLASARGLSQALRDRYFVAATEGWAVRPEVKRHVHFREFNLLDSYALLGRFDVIFCRNVLIYFSEVTKRDVLARLRAALNPGGYLFLGASEALLQHADAFEAVRCNLGVVYRRR